MTGEPDTQYIDFVPEETRDLSAELVRAVQGNDAAAVNKLLHEGADVNGEGGNGHPIILAAYYGYADVAKALLEAGADPSIPDTDSAASTPAVHAFSRGHGDVVEVLKKYVPEEVAQLHRKYMNGQLVEAAQTNNVAAVEALLKAGADVNEGGAARPLLYAAYNGHYDTVKILLEAGADPTLADTDGTTARQYAYNRGHARLWRMIKSYEFPEQVTIEREVGSSFMEEVYDFERMERISVLHTQMDGAPVSFEREHFSDIKDETSLRKAFNLHRQRGGKAEESAVFPRKLDKKSGAPSL